MSSDLSNEQRNRTLEAPPSALSTATNLQDQRTSPSEEMNKGYVKPLIAELVGTFVFVFIGAGSIITGVPYRVLHPVVPFGRDMQHEINVRAVVSTGRPAPYA